MQKKKTQMKLFITVFAALAVLVIVQNLVREKVISLSVPDNAGVSVLETVDNSLVCIFQDGKVVTWDWNTLPQPTGDFMAASDRAILLDAGHLAAVNRDGKKVLTVYTLPDGQKQKDLSVGWDDQDVSLRISPDKQSVALIRRNAADSKGGVLYEFLTVDLEKERVALPVSLSMQADSEDFVDTALNNGGVLVAVGSKDDTGRTAAVDLRKGTILWDVEYPGTDEFCSIAVSPDGTSFYAGSRDGILYKLNAVTGEMVKKIHLLEEGETRPITNDTSVLNLAFSPDGRYYVATINPKAYIVKTESDEIAHDFSPADRLVSKIAFSPDNQFVATSDIRAGYPVKIWPMPEGNK